MNKIYLLLQDIEGKKWYVIDVEGQCLGRLVIVIVMIIRGKNKLIYIFYMDIGDFVIVVNVEKVIVIGKKSSQKFYCCYLGRLGGMKIEVFFKL